MSLTPGDILQNRYRIVALLGQGGMGAVYRAWDLRLEVPVALKEQLPQPGLDAGMLAQLRQQFRQEAVTLARLSHPNLVKVTDFFDEGGNVYLVMEFLQGESLANRIAREGVVPETQVLDWAQQLLHALNYCHNQGIVHRDIKPQNILLRPDGRAVLVDFGLVKLWNPNDPQTRTVMRGMGTPEYAPPEQYGKQGQTTDPRSDLYSLGATLYHALTGQVPPTASDRIAYPELFKPVRALNPRVSAITEAGILRALEPAANQRWSQANDMAAALKSKTVRRRPITLLPQPNAARSANSGTAVMPQTQSRSLASVARGIPTWGWVVGAVVVLIALAAGWNALDRPTRLTPTATATEMVTQTSKPTATSSPEPTPSATPLLEPKLGDIRTRETDGMVMVHVPAGEFQMGSVTYDNEEPVHTVALDAFWLDRTEVTNAQFTTYLNQIRQSLEVESDEFVFYNGELIYDLICTDCSKNWEERIIWDGTRFDPVPGFEDHPVVLVSWKGANSYCSSVNCRLPTEAEWEYAARGPEELTYPWGNGWDCTRGNLDTNCGSDTYDYTAPVGRFPAGWTGALDLAGNVWEWVADWYGSYPSERQVNPTGPQSGDYRVLRGGSWDYSGSITRGALRGRGRPTGTYSDLGFRCGVSAAPGE